MIEARKVRPDEVEEYRHIGGYSYGNWSDEMREWTPGPDQLANMLGVFSDDRIVARLTNHSYEQIVRGVWRSASGIGGVATWPEDRRQGHVRRLLDATFEDMREKGQAVSALFPFNQSFYAKFGYVRTNPIPRVRLKVQALSHLLPLTNEAGKEWRYDRARAVDSIAECNDFVYQLAQQHGNLRYNGFMRDPHSDADDCRDQQVVFVRETQGNQDEQPTAVARYTLKGYGPDGINMVHECHWVDAKARDRLLAFFALHAAGMPLVQMSVPAGLNFHQWLSDSDGPYDVHMSEVPLMVRVMDVVQAINGVRVDNPADNCGTISFQVEDPICPWVGGTFEVSESAGVLEVQSVDKQRIDKQSVDKSSTVLMSIEGVTALAYGTLSVDEIAHKGWISGLSTDDRAVLDSWFPEQRVFNLLGF